MIANKFFIALTGQMGFFPREGILRIFTVFFDCMVLDHLTSKWRTGGANMTSLRAN